MAIEMNNDIINELNPTQEHFLKKYLLENRLTHELHLLSKPNCCQLFGPPFKSTPEQNEEYQFPLLKFFFNNFVATFPFVASNTPGDQLSFWRDTVQEFLESFNLKDISDSQERQDNTTKRKQINKKMLSSLLLFFNSMLITEKDMDYLHNKHLKPSETGTLDKIRKKPNSLADGVSLEDFGGLEEYHKMKFTNDLNLNIVAVKHIKDQNGPSSSGSTGTSKWNLFREVSRLSPYINDSVRHNYEFVIQYTKRVTDGKGTYCYTSYFIPRPYHDFKKLEHDLKKKYPGLMSTDVPKLPEKLKRDDGILSNIDTESSQVLSRNNSSDTYENNVDNDMSSKTVSSLNLGSVTPGRPQSLVRERLRLALRGYLNNLIKHNEIIHSDIFHHFVFNPHLQYGKLSATEVRDYENRLKHEKAKAETQFEFQKQTAIAILELGKNFDEFKRKLIMNPEALTEIFEEIGKSPKVENLSPLLKTFVEWSKLEVSATLYQVFLSVDNSSEWLQKCKRFHSLFPYNIVYGILKFTNPMKMVSRIIDLLLANFPSFSLPLFGFSGSKELSEASKSTKARNLLSLMFIMLLDEDLNDFKKELKNLKEEKLSGNMKYEPFLQRIENYVNIEDSVVEDIKEDSRNSGDDLLLTLLSTCRLKPVLNSQDRETYNAITRSYESYEEIKDKEKLSECELYFNLKQYWQILLRKKDKDIMKQLWQEPELTRLIKKFLTIFYQPLMRVFAKCDIHLVFKDFQRFMDDLLSELTQLSEGDMYYMSPFEIFERSKAVFDKHENTLWGFIHNLYLKDDEKLFLNIIKWIEKFLFMLRIKFTETSKVTINLKSITPKDIDQDILLQHLNQKINKTLQKRVILKQYLNNKAQLDETVNTQDAIDDQWNYVNDGMLPEISGDDFGLNDDDIDDFNLLHKESEANADSRLDKELHMKLSKLEKELDVFGTSELDKFDDLLRPHLDDLLTNIH